MYCSAALPSRAPESTETVPDLDQLVRDTLSGKRANGIRALQETLAGRPAPPPLPTPRRALDPEQAVVRPPRPEPLPPDSLVPLGASPSGAPPAAPAASPERRTVQALAEDLEAARAGQDPAALGTAITAMRSALAALEVEATAWSTPPKTEVHPPSPPVYRPVLPVRPQSWALVIEGCADGSRAQALSQALQTDAATARQLALARTPRAVRWAAHAAPLQAAARQIRSHVGLGAVVVSQAALHRSPSAVTVLGPGPGAEHLEITPEPAWLTELPPQPQREFVRWDGVVLSVPGEVVVRRFRAGPRGPVPAGERRVRLLDLHSADRCFRVVLGVTEFRGLPGHTENSAIKSLQALATGVPWPGVRVLAGRTVSSAKLPTPDALSSGPAEVTGWPLWEEYTRMARALAGLG